MIGAMPSSSAFVLSLAGPGTLARAPFRLGNAKRPRQDAPALRIAEQIAARLPACGWHH
jgi:hypothetical protein